MAWPPLKQQLSNAMDPGYLLWYSAIYHITTAYQFLVVEHHLPTLTNLKKVKEDAFASFWNWLTKPVIPPPQPVGSATLVPPLIAKAHGKVLHIGPGSGAHVAYFSGNSNIDVVLAAEPAVGMHSDLQGCIDAANLPFKYQIINSTADKASLIPALRTYDEQFKSSEHIFDSIISVRVLCSVPDLDKTTRELYQMLKPGGQLILVEHVKNPWTTTGSLFARSMQIVWHLLGWKFFLAGCHLNRDTAAALKNAGNWAKFDLKLDFEWAPFTYISGILTKPL
ncbi:hypothetical protein LTR84_009508 [Exophiala bonariae]|uniref:Methyltransferase type 11 domain-containing protein n=1 Tax=Exophiala bonariae TaxID=1690606 RepID=A0AAV9MU96_9EURO|nr:hypothetical protein LTR84_009508 [Exophiala bonariae]